MVPCMVYECWCTCFDKNLTLYNRFLHILWSNGLASMCILHIHDLPFPFCVFFLLAMQFTKKLCKFFKLLQISRKKSSIVFIEKKSAYKWTCAVWIRVVRRSTIFHRIYDIFNYKMQHYFNIILFSSVAQSCPTLCDPMDCSTPGFPVHHQLLKFNILELLISLRKKK